MSRIIQICILSSLALGATVDHCVAQALPSGDPGDGSGSGVVSMAIDGQNRPLALWRLPNGRAGIWRISVGGEAVVQRGELEAAPGWRAESISIGNDGVIYVLWTKLDGTASVWKVTPELEKDSEQQYLPREGWVALDTAMGDGNQPWVLWRQSDGRASLWKIHGDWAWETIDYAGWGGWHPVSVTASPEGEPLLLKGHWDGRAAVWKSRTDGSRKNVFRVPAHEGLEPWRIAAASDGEAWILWKAPGGKAAITSYGRAGIERMSRKYDSGAGASAEALAIGPGGAAWLAWQRLDGTLELWALAGDGRKLSGNTFPKP